MSPIISPRAPHYQTSHRFSSVRQRPASTRFFTLFTLSLIKLLCESSAVARPRASNDTGSTLYALSILDQWQAIITIAAILLLILFFLSLWFVLTRQREAKEESTRLNRLIETERRRFDGLTTNLDGIVWETRLDPITRQHTTTFVSSQVENMLGYAAAEWLSTPDFCLKLVHEEDRDRVVREYEDILGKGRKGVLQFRWIAKDNRTLWVRANLTPIFDDTGKAVGSYGVTTDMTGQQLAEVSRRESEESTKKVVDELRFSEDRFAKAFRSNPQPMSLTTLAEGRYVDVNESFVAMSSYKREDVIGRTSLELKIWETNDHRARFMQRLNEMGSIINEETKFRTKDGSLRVLLSSAEKLDIAGQECVLIASSDVTEIVHSRQALAESEQRFRNLANAAPVMIWIAATDMQCSYLNKQWLDFRGRTLEEELGDGWTQGIHPDDYAHCLEVFKNSFDHRQSFGKEYRLCRYDGEYRWVYDCGTPYFSTDNVFLGFIGSCIDITERKESEVALRTAHEELQQLKNQLESENIYLQQELQRDEKFGEIVGESDAIKYVLFKITQVAPTDSTVLITGETGTGKELVARAIHTASQRKERALIKVNCAALSPTLIESELFGHEKGAFTGAGVRKEGRFELADGGTIFLDEIGELTPELQAKLLRVIQENEFERIGGNKTIKVNVRIIAATNRNLKLEVEQGSFREDLWYRLSVYPITIPPLRQRKEDIPLLVEHFASTYSKKFGKTIASVSPRAIQNLQTHSWPGNIRELANVIERAVIHTQGNVLQVEHFDQPDLNTIPTQTLEEVERDYIILTLENTGWRIEGPYGAAKILGLNPSTLRTRMSKLGIQRRRAQHSLM